MGVDAQLVKVGPASLNPDLSDKVSNEAAELAGMSWVFGNTNKFKQTFPSGISVEVEKGRVVTILDRSGKALHGSDALVGTWYRLANLQESKAKVPDPYGCLKNFVREF